MAYKYNPLTGQLDYYQTGSGGGGGAVDSVNAQTGAVVLDAADVGADPAGTAQTLFNTLGDKDVRTTRFASIGAGTGGTVGSLPAISTVVLNDFGGTVDAVISTISGGRPTLEAAKTTGGEIIATTFDSLGNYVLTGVPSAYPVAIIYRVKQKLSDFDSTSSDIMGIPDVDHGNVVYQAEQEVDFGTGGDAGFLSYTVPALWITSTTKLIFTIGPNLTDHDYEDSLLEEIKCTYGAIVPGTSFDLYVYAPNQTHGRYIITAIGV
jgi:hypothetical protein